MEAKRVEGKRWTADDVIKVQKIMAEYDVQSLNEKVRAGRDIDEDTEVGDMIEGPNNVEEDFVKIEQRKYVVKLLDKLSPREQLIIVMRFGLDGNEPKTLEAIGEHFNVTHERIRQVEAKALKKLKSVLKKSDLFEEYL